MIFRMCRGSGLYNLSAPAAVVIEQSKLLQSPAAASRPNETKPSWLIRGAVEEFLGYLEQFGNSRITKLVNRYPTTLICTESGQVVST